VKVTELESWEPNCRPMHEDAYHMGVDIHTNCMVLTEKFAKDRGDYIIVVDIETGQRIKIDFNDND
jgi:hypothetical protein